ncbi:hypothetical protein TVAG_240780 [Trichomonas vaginalis G3]|uniref:E3 ubiquitin-protein ligase n=1 Tax=Trichomonas vaginalis (strain ATCC PRA-98 / G3) TaxID=412133 RepID=A2EJC5_TRIV3|nr:ubiquitin-dependent protein catabolic process via the N-end rule pathway [Trichomonas vaginalis G3]EAY07277.1 hypothetical protein TVAG_240780 [Trichomonas vaginalis G3]KAI5511951.1 ubiquitin-dependent protein catabolic process via the N-end rule pathway [Trichomonas vaginalis G3]|eukprot:XP_001319500.1 hypothetical protein [Trichomonas vaginalis G3]
MVELLRDTLDVSVKEGIRFAELLMTNDGLKEFSEFKKEIKSKSETSMCSKHFCSHVLNVSCKTCMGNKSGSFCIECFMKGNHEGHEYVISQNVLPMCLCGHKELVDSKCFCHNHKGISENSTTKIFTEAQIKLFSQIFDIMVQFLVNVYPIELAYEVIKWLTSLANLGDSFLPLIAESFTKNNSENLIKIAESLSHSPSNSSNSILGLFIVLTSNTKFLRELGEKSIPLVSKFLEFTAENNKIIKSLFDVVALSYIDPEFSLYMIKEQNLIPKLIEQIIPFSKISQDKMIDIYCIPLFSIIIQSTSSLECAKYWAIENLDSRMVFIKLLETFQFACAIVRKTGDKEAYNNSSVQLQQISLTNIWKSIKNFVHGFTSLTTPDPAILYDIVRPAVKTFLDWYESRNIVKVESSVFGITFPGLNALTVEFSYSLPLNLFLHILIFSLYNFYKLDPNIFIREIGLQSLLPLCVHPIETVAAIGLAQANAYVRNAENVPKVANEINLSKQPPATLISFYSLFQYLISTENDATEFIATVVHSFGLSNWLATTQINQSIELQDQLILLFRFFIHLLSETIQKLFETEKMTRQRMSVIHFLYLHTSTAKEIKSQIAVFGMTAKEWNALLDEIAITVKNEKSTLYKLKPEFKSQRTPFFPFYLTTQFYSALAQELEGNQTKLVSTPDVEHLIFPNLPKFVSQKGFILFMDTIARNIAAMDEINSTMFQCFLALVHMGIKCSVYDKSDNFPNSLIEKDDSCLRILVNQKIMSQKTLGKPLLELFDIIQTEFPHLKEKIHEITSPFENADESNKTKINRKAIISQFMSRLEEFEQFNIESLSETSDDEEKEEKELVCAFCKKELTPGKDIYGILARIDPSYGDDVNEMNDITVPLFSFCPHYVHLTCFNESRPEGRLWTQCPLCRQQSSVLLPVLGISEEADKAEFPVLELFLRTAGHKCHPASLLSSYFRKKEITDRISKKRHYSQAEISAEKSICLIARGPPGDHPLPRKSQTPQIEQFIKLENKTEEEFWNNIKTIFGENPPRTFVRRCAMMINALNDKELIPIPEIQKIPNENEEKTEQEPSEKTEKPQNAMVIHGLTLSDRFEPKIFLDNAYPRFSQYFFAENDFQSRFMWLRSMDIARCLCCGEFFSISQKNNSLRYPYFFESKTGEARSHRCKHGLPIFLVLTGKSASAVIYYSHRTLMIEWGSIYLTERGDQDIGLSLMDDLYLNQNLLTKLKMEMYDGTIYRNAKRDADHVDLDFDFNLLF